MKLHQRSFRKSLSYAFNGWALAVRFEANMRIHLTCAFVAVTMGFLFQLTRIEWLFLLLAIALVLFAELMNTAVEANVDLVTKEKKHEAMVAKDVAAGAVLLASCYALITGIILFGGKILGY
jgi:diacylglycerol kinase